MPYLYRLVLSTLFFLNTAFFSLSAQDLEYLTPVITRHPNQDSTVSLILTADNQRRTHNKQNKPYIQSVQIVDADQPWPPRWFSGTAPYTDDVFNKDTAQGYARFDFIEDVRIVAGHLSFFKLLGRPPMEQSALDSPELDAYMLLNEKMECIDTVSSLTAFRNLYFHDISINEKGEKLVSLRKDTYLDLRDYTNNQADFSRHCEIDIIEELDAKDSVLLSWNPLYHIDPNLFKFKEVLASHSFASNTDAIQWTRLTSAQWDYDGNILYSMKHLGIGKISLADGHIMWQINAVQMPIISGNDTIQWYAQHDFNYRYQTDTTAIYTLYSDGLRDQGDDASPIIIKPSCGVLFEINKKTSKVKVLHYQHPKERFVAVGQGGYDPEKNGDYLISYGFLRVPIEENAEWANFLEYGKKDGTTTFYQLPQGITCYKAHKLEGFKRPPRPVITKKGDELQATGDMGDFTWYRLSGPNNTIVEKVGTGNAIRYGTGGIFCVAGKYGIGYAVSKPFSIFANAPY